MPLLRRRRPAPDLEALPPPPDLRAELAPITIDDELLDVELTRDAAWAIPAVAAGLQVIAGTIGTFPLFRARPDRTRETDPFLERIDPQEPREATLTRVVEDLVLFPHAYLVVLARFDDGRPRWARYVPYEDVTPPDVDTAERATSSIRWAPPGPTSRSSSEYEIKGQRLPATQIIRFDSHWPGLLWAGRRALVDATKLNAAAARYTDSPLPSGVLKNTGADLPATEVEALLQTWEVARNKRGTAYLNSSIDFEAGSLRPDQLQLQEARDYQVAELARLLNIPTTYISAPQPSGSSTSTYANLETQRRDLVDLTLRPYIAAIESRLSSDDVTPRGTSIRLDLDTYLRSDAATRFAAWEVALRAGFLTVDEVRELERLTPLDDAQEASDDE